MMNNQWYKVLIRYVISFGFGVALVFIALDLRNYGEITDITQKYRALADAFTIPGVVLLMVGLLVILSNEGSLTALGYGLRRLKDALLPFTKKEIVTYKEYAQSKQKITGFSFLFITGAIFLIVGIVFTILFFQ